jgi:Flp pilus assembly protein TadG
VISGSLAKIVLVLVLLGAAVVEVGSPMVTRAQLDGVAHDAADSAAHELFERPDMERARATAAQLVTERGAQLKAFTVDTQGIVHVTVQREARSLVLKRWSQAEDWYDVEVDASSTPRSR